MLTSYRKSSSYHLSHNLFKRLSIYQVNPPSKKIKTSHKSRVKNRKFYCLFRRPPTSTEEKPVASVRPVQSTPVSMMPRQASASSAPGNDSSKCSLGGFPVNCLQKAGVFVQKIVTTTGKQILHALHFISILSVSTKDYYFFMALNSDCLSSSLYRHSDSRHQQLHRCPGQDHRWREYPCHQGH